MPEFCQNEFALYHYTYHIWISCQIKKFVIFINYRIAHHRKEIGICNRIGVY